MKNRILQFGADHYNMLLLCNEVQSSNDGIIPLSRIRVNAEKRSLVVVDKWTADRATKWRDGQIIDTKHDDLDVIDDLESVGWIMNIALGTTPIVLFETQGYSVLAALLEHKKNQGSLSTFRLSESQLEAAGLNVSVNEAGDKYQLQFKQSKQGHDGQPAT